MQSASHSTRKQHVFSADILQLFDIDILLARLIWEEVSFAGAVLKRSEVFPNTSCVPGKTEQYIIEKKK